MAATPVEKIIEPIMDADTVRTAVATVVEEAKA